MTTILLARHGETDWNRDLRFQGHADPPLNEAGREQARRLAENLDGVPIDAIYTSDLRRARETAEIVAERKRVTVRLDQGLREIDVGSWSGLTREEVAERFPAAERHDGETPEQLLARVLAAVRRIAAAHPGERILIVSHGGSLGTLRRHALATNSVPRLENCAVYRLAYEDGAFRSVD